MTGLFNDSPEELVALRKTVQDWLGKARDAVITFFDEHTYSFKRDIKEGVPSPPSAIHLTNTARCYMSLVYASRCVESNQEQKYENIHKYLEEKFLPAFTKEKSKESNFEIAHSADLIFTKEFSDQYKPGTSSTGSTSTEPISKIKLEIENCGKQKNVFVEGQMCFESADPDSKHFFVTLHFIRSLEIVKLKGILKKTNPQQIAKNAERFCIQHCFYSQRGLHHLFDTMRLAFAFTIYVLYSQRVDKNICMAVTEAIAEAQQPSGNWPATHPIIRKGKEPWYIATHEIPVCLTWLYFQPRLPDAARPVLLRMMERYFTKWVIPTYLIVRSGDDTYKGWCDDRVNGHDKIMGWATSIVCHFLANYYMVLNDHINRRVIEVLQLQQAERYLIDENEHNGNDKWKIKDTNNAQAIWPDLGTFFWDAQCDEGSIVAKIQDSWTDPTIGYELSHKLGKHVLYPIFQNPCMRPENYISGILGGPPGTRKTTLVKTISNILKWPYVPIPASAIFEKGFNEMEAQASTVFRMLTYLTNCVIFFDEFEEFLRDRRDEIAPTVHDRTIAAFTTAAMLPRFQDLHDAKRCLIFLATNHLGKIDEAIIRPGRFDFQETIDHPEIIRFTDSQKSYLNCLTKRTFEELYKRPKDGIPKNSERQRYETLIRNKLIPVFMRVLGSKEIAGQLQTVTKLSINHVPFHVVESVLLELAKEIDKDHKIANDSAKLNMKINDTLIGEINKIRVDRGPQELPPSGSMKTSKKRPAKTASPGPATKPASRKK